MELYKILFIHEGEIIKLLNSDKKTFEHNLSNILSHAQVVYSGKAEENDYLEYLNHGGHFA